MTAARVMASTRTGTAQRWCLFSNPRPGAGVSPEPGSVLWGSHEGDAVTLTVDYRVARAIIGRRVDALRFGSEEVTAHRDFRRLKVAGGLRLLDHETGYRITMDDWELAGMVVDTSD